jgi:hypothetical protein
LALSGLGVFILLDIVVGQLVEPHLYGHATGLSPLSVVVGTIFWSWLWGPAGLILSTPITVCLLVAGRHMKGLGVLELLLGNSTPLTLPQKFHQQGPLSGDSHEIPVCPSKIAACRRLSAIDKEPNSSRKQELRFEFRLGPIDGEGYVSIPTQSSPAAFRKCRTPRVKFPAPR